MRMTRQAPQPQTSCLVIRNGSTTKQGPRLTAGRYTSSLCRNVCLDTGHLPELHFATTVDEAIRQRVKGLTSQVLQQGRLDPEAVRDVARTVMATAIRMSTSTIPNSSARPTTR